MRRIAFVAVAVLVVLAGCGAGGPTGTATETPTDTPGDSMETTEPPTDTEAPPETETATAEPADEAPPDPEEDVLGWEDGYWYNESVTVDRSDGLNESELEAVVARGMARVEQVRELEFEQRVPVEVISREQFAQNLQNDSGEPSPSNYLHQNAKWEAMFMVNESADAISVRQRSSGASIGGYYSPSEERIVIVSENTTSPKMDEITLAQELFHALQDQQFDLSDYNQSTRELHNARDGIIEGDGNYVDYLYEQRCNEEWECLMPESSGGGSGNVHAGILVTQFVPYSEGPELVRQVHQEQGWEAVNEMYDNPPASTEQIIHHEKYGEDEPTQVTIDHSPSGDWQVLELEGGINYAQFGEGGLYAMLWYSSYEASVESGAARTIGVPYTHLFVYKEGGQELRDIGPYNYSHPATAGWEGDKLVPYVNGEATEDAEMGYVWQIEWESNGDAQEFVDAYTEVLKYHGAEQVSENTWRIPEGNEFADAFYVSVEGSTVTIVNAPTTDDLGDVHADAGN
jgi:hypothetical protein